jgi:hypothetical protein
MTLIQSLDFMPKDQGMLPETSAMAFPMPCRGAAWQSNTAMVFQDNPLMQRLGLSEVGEPAPELRSPLND